MAMGDGLFQQPFGLQVAQHRLAAFVAIHPGVGTGRGVHSPARVHDHDFIQPMGLADREVVEVVSGSDFHRAGAEAAVDGGVGDYRNHARDQRQPQMLANQMLIAGVRRD